MKRRNFSNFSPIQAPNLAIRRYFGTRRVINHHFSAFGTDFSLCGRPSPTKNGRHACQVVSRKGNGLSPTKYFLDSFAHDQTCLVSGMPGGTTINSASLGFFCHVGGDPHGRAPPVQIHAHRTLCPLPRWPCFFLIERIIMVFAASLSAVPEACVVSISTASPFRFSMSA